jgi:hypothetical protein
LEKFLKNAQLKQENQISTLVFLGVTAPFIKGAGAAATLAGISKKILALFEKGKFIFLSSEIFYLSTSK